MPSVATQTDASTVTTRGFRTWCRQNMDVVDGIQPRETPPSTHLWESTNKKVGTSHKD